MENARVGFHSFLPREGFPSPRLEESDLSGVKIGGLVGRKVCLFKIYRVHVLKKRFNTRRPEYKTRAG